MDSYTSYVLRTRKYYTQLSKLSKQATASLTYTIDRFRMFTSSLSEYVSSEKTFVREPILHMCTSLSTIVEDWAVASNALRPLPSVFDIKTDIGQMLHTLKTQAQAKPPLHQQANIEMLTAAANFEFSRIQDMQSIFYNLSRVLVYMGVAAVEHAPSLTKVSLLMDPTASVVDLATRFQHLDLGVGNTSVDILHLSKEDLRAHSPSVAQRGFSQYLEPRESNSRPQSTGPRRRGTSESDNEHRQRRARSSAIESKRSRPRTDASREGRKTEALERKATRQEDYASPDTPFSEHDDNVAHDSRARQPIRKTNHRGKRRPSASSLNEEPLPIRNDKAAPTVESFPTKRRYSSDNSAPDEHDNAPAKPRKEKHRHRKRGTPKTPQSKYEPEELSDRSDEDRPSKPVKQQVRDASPKKGEAASPKQEAPRTQPQKYDTDESEGTESVKSPASTMKKRLTPEVKAPDNKNSSKSNKDGGVSSAQPDRTARSARTSDASDDFAVPLPSRRKETAKDGSKEHDKNPSSEKQQGTKVPSQVHPHDENLGLSGFFDADSTNSHTPPGGVQSNDRGPRAGAALSKTEPNYRGSTLDNPASKDSNSNFNFGDAADDYDLGETAPAVSGSGRNNRDIYDADDSPDPKREPARNPATKFADIYSTTNSAAVEKEGATKKPKKTPHQDLDVSMSPVYGDTGDHHTDGSKASEAKPKKDDFSFL